MKYEIMKKTLLLLALATLPATAQRSQDKIERDLRRIEGKIDQIEFDQDQREARVKLAEEERIRPRKFFSVKVADDFFLKVFGFVFRFVFC